MTRTQAFAVALGFVAAIAVELVGLSAYVAVQHPQSICLERKTNR